MLSMFLCHWDHKKNTSSFPGSSSLMLATDSSACAVNANLNLFQRVQSDGTMVSLPECGAEHVNRVGM